MKKSERVLDFVVTLRNGHVSQQHLHQDDGEYRAAAVHAVTAEALAAVEAMLVSVFDLDEQEYE